MTNTKFRKRILLSSVAMLLVALVALGSATFAWFSVSPTANATGLILQSTASSGIVVRSDSANKAGQAYSKTTYLNATSAGTASSTTPVVLDPAGFIGVDNTTKKAKLARTTSDDATKARHGSESINSVTYDSDATNGPQITNGIFAERVFIQSLDGEDTDVYVSGVTVTASTSTNTKTDVKACVYALVVDKDGRVLAHTNNGGSAPARYLTTDTGTWSTSVETTTAPATVNPQLTTAVDGTDNNYVWVIVYLDGENDAVRSNNVDATELISSVNVEFHTGTAA